MNLALAPFSLLHHLNMTLCHLDKGPAIYVLSAHIGGVLDMVINFSLVIKNILDLLLGELRVGVLDVELFSPSSRFWRVCFLHCYFVPVYACEEWVLHDLKSTFRACSKSTSWVSIE